MSIEAQAKANVPLLVTAVASASIALSIVPQRVLGLLGGNEVAYVQWFRSFEDKSANFTHFVSSKRALGGSGPSCWSELLEKMDIESRGGSDGPLQLEVILNEGWRIEGFSAYQTTSFGGTAGEKMTWLLSR